MTKKKGSPTKDRRLTTKKSVKPEPRVPESDVESESESSQSEQTTTSQEESSSGSDSSSTAAPTTPNRSAIRTVRKQVKPTKKTPIASRATPRKNNATGASTAGVRKKPKIRVFKEIAQLQRSTNLLIPKAPFLRLVRELMVERSQLFYSRNNALLRITPTALEALREASECYMVSVFEDAYMLALHSKRVTLMPKDITLLMSLRGHDAGTQ